MAASLTSKILFAAVGDVHGHMHAMVRLLGGWEAKTGRTLSFVLQVGDFEPIRDERDLETMAAPAKYRVVGDFPDFYAGRAAFPWPVYFIGGNHKPYGFLDEMPDGGDAIENCVYVGRAGLVEIGGLRIAGLSGIFDSEAFERPRPGVDAFGKVSRKEFTYFRKGDVDRAAGFGAADVLLVHEWPEGVIDPADSREFERQRRSLRYDVVGNEYARLLMEVLEPRLVLCGHMHKSYRNRVRLESGEEANVRCLASMHQAREAVAIFEVAADGSMAEIWPDPASAEG